MIDSFVEQTPGVTDAIAVSADGLLMAMSKSLDRAGADVTAESLRERLRSSPVSGAKDIIVIDRQKRILHIYP